MPVKRPVPPPPNTPSNATSPPPPRKRTEIKEILDESVENGQVSWTEEKREALRRLRTPEPINSGLVIEEKLLQRIAELLKYPKDWDTSVYPTLLDAILEVLIVYSLTSESKGE